jgi:hypothetical protein
MVPPDSKGPISPGAIIYCSRVGSHQDVSQSYVSVFRRDVVLRVPAGNLLAKKYFLSHFGVQSPTTVRLIDTRFRLPAQIECIRVERPAGVISE